ncbi:hypothetical protein H6G35_20770 [Aulosira sp. FACHB-113]|nr:hypothetical protein [Aulosira sp. FACHB-113]
MPQLLHYTLNTDNTFDCSNKQYQPETLKLLHPIAARAILGGKAEDPLPYPFEDYTVNTTVDGECAMFDVRESSITLTSNAVVWSHTKQELCWELFEHLYLNLMGECRTIPRTPHMPNTVPWLATITMPTLGAAVSWMADFEQCFAIALIEASTGKSYA